MVRKYYSNASPGGIFSWTPSTVWRVATVMAFKESYIWKIGVYDYD